MKDVDALEVRTGSGLSFTVLPGRALDIAWMDYQGKPVSFISKGGVTNAQYYQPYGYEWLRSFYAGMLTTCGLTHAGPPEKDGIWDLGLHGRISNTPAFEVSHRTEWEGDSLKLTIEGKVREAAIFNENLVLKRKITAYGGESTITIEDEVENQGYQETPFMILYHMNAGYPAVSEESSLQAPVINTRARDDEAARGIDSFWRFQPPEPGYKEQVFFHKLASDEDGNTCAGVVNEALNFGLYIRFNQKELPLFTQWKMMGQQDYVLGLEPGNCYPLGRSLTRQRGELAVLEPGGKKNIRLDIGVLSTWEEIQCYKDYVNKLVKGKR